MYISLSLKPGKTPPLIEQTRIQRDANKDWNSIIKHHAKLKNDQAILFTYTQMESLGVAPHAATLPLVFKACTRLHAFERGKRIHRSIEETNLIGDVRIGTAVVDFYCKCGHLGEADKVFDKITERDLVLWNALMSGYVGCGYYEGAIRLIREMQREGLKPNSRTLVSSLLACEGLLNLRLGREIHGYCLRNGYFRSCPYVDTALIGFYMNFDVTISSLVFDLMVAKSTVSWNAMITGYFDVGDFRKAFEMFIQMFNDGIKFDLVTILVVIQAIAEFGSIELGMQIHQLAIKLSYGNDLFIANALLNMYVDIGNLKLARRLFDTVSTHDVALWNSMIAAYVDYNFYDEAISLFITMRKETREEEGTIAVMLSLCAELADGLKKGRSIHAIACKSGMEMSVSVGNSLLAMYADLGCIEHALKVFYEMNDVDVVSYNTLILALSSSNLREESWELFGMMRESEVNPNCHTMISLLAACGDETCLNVGRSVHGFVIKHGIEISLELNTSLIDMYMNCCDEETARYLFDACASRDLVSWNAIIAAFVRNSRASEALLYFNRMISEVEPNSVTIINVLSTCTDLANLPRGQCLHAYATRRFSPSGLHLSLTNAVLTMYTKCGSMQNAEKIFKTLTKRNIVSWNAMITGYGANGCAHDAILAFMKMLEDGFQPNGLTFLSVLSACRHAGLIEKGMELFRSMVQEFKLTPVLAHYSCVVDLLSRGGCLDEARDFIDSMPIEPDASVWRALLSACRVHYNVQLAADIFQNLVELEPMNAGNYILLSNTYAAAGLWSEVRQVRRWLREKGLKKPPGTSWIVIRDEIHSFTAGDTSHPQSNRIYENLNSLLWMLRESGYVTEFHLAIDNEED
ncbi:pentatricopeptide repeat-containing protein At5g39350-like [Euphorbia lathyris]|uniref:pentatricopeptide repeat-containing protein At5g39350-like n=1 Tax=Euphorbia lathyris TaxID=212925 RepID=UPI003313F640